MNFHCKCEGFMSANENLPCQQCYRCCTVLLGTPVRRCPLSSFSYPLYSHFYLFQPLLSLDPVRGQMEVNLAHESDLVSDALYSNIWQYFDKDWLLTACLSNLPKYSASKEGCSCFSYYVTSFSTQIFLMLSDGNVFNQVPNNSYFLLQCHCFLCYSTLSKAYQQCGIVILFPVPIFSSEICVFYYYMILDLGAKGVHDRYVFLKGLFCQWFFIQRRQSFRGNFHLHSFFLCVFCRFALIRCRICVQFFCYKEDDSENLVNITALKTHMCHWVMFSWGLIRSFFNSGFLFSTLPRSLGQSVYEDGLLMADIHLCHIHSIS